MCMSIQRNEEFERKTRVFQAKVQARIEAGDYPPGYEYLAVDDVRKRYESKREDSLPFNVSPSFGWPALDGGYEGKL